MRRQGDKMKHDSLDREPARCNQISVHALSVSHLCRVQLRCRVRKIHNRGEVPFIDGAERERKEAAA